MNDPIHIKFYTRTACPLCEKAKKILVELKSEFPLIIEEIDIYKDDALLENYQIMIPVVEIDGEEVEYGIVSKETLTEYLQIKYAN